MAGPGKRGPVGHVPTDEQRSLASQLSGFGLPHDQICLVLKISKPTLYKHYQSELDAGAAEANGKIARRLFEIALQGEDRTSVPACIFWLKARAGWSEKQQIDVNDITVPHTIEEARAKAAAIVKQLGSEGEGQDEGEEE